MKKTTSCATYMFCPLVAERYCAFKLNLLLEALFSLYAEIDASLWPNSRWLSHFNGFIYCLLYLCLSSRLTFTNPDKDDLGGYSVAVTDTDGVSASHTLTEDGGSRSPKLHVANTLFSFVFSLCLLLVFIFSCPAALNTMLELSYAIRNPSESRASAADLLEPFIASGSHLLVSFVPVQLFLWNTGWTMRFWRKDTCVSGCRLSNCPHLCPTGSSSTTRRSPAGR